MSNLLRSFSLFRLQIGPHLNYDELVVYDPAAALPTHFVVYRV